MLRDRDAIWIRHERPFRWPGKLAEQSELRRIEFSRSSRDAAANVVCQIDVDVVEIEIDNGARASECMVEVFRNDNDRSHSLCAECAFSLG